MEWGGQAFRKIDRGRETDGQEETEGKRDKDTEQQSCELIYRFTCVHE